MYQIVLTPFFDVFIRMVGSNKLFFQTKVRSVQIKSVPYDVHLFIFFHISYNCTKNEVFN